jgi:uncharacterized surface protein with fasciclin (FAS1) repeats
MMKFNASIFLALVGLLSAPSLVTGQMESDVFSFEFDGNSTDLETSSSPTDSPTGETCVSLADILCADGSNLVALCEAIQISELTDDLEDDVWTIFAPTDSAFEALGRDNLDALVFGNDTVPLTDLLLFHIVPGVSLTSDLLPCEAGNNLLEMANGEDSRTLCVDRVKPIEQRGKFNGKEDAPKFLEMDIMACNGVVHILDKVLLFEALPFPIPSDTPSSEIEDEKEEDEPTEDEGEPEDETALTTASGTITSDGQTKEIEPECLSIAELACSSSYFSVLCTLLMDNELVDALNDGSWTVFAPTNDAFDDAPPFPAGIDIAEVLKGHVAGNVIYFEDLVCTEKITMLNGKQTRTVCKNGNTYQKGRSNSNEERPEIIEPNVEACNGVLHVVDQVILSL